MWFLLKTRRDEYILKPNLARYLWGGWEYSKSYYTTEVLTRQFGEIEQEYWGFYGFASHIDAKCEHRLLTLDKGHQKLRNLGIPNKTINSLATKYFNFNQKAYWKWFNKNIYNNHKYMIIKTFCEQTDKNLKMLNHPNDIVIKKEL